MNHLIKLIAVALCLLFLVSCAPHDPGYENTIASAGCSDVQVLSDGALNKELLQDEESSHLPIFKMDTLEDLEQFKSKYENALSMDRGHKALSFEAALSKANWDRESFFEDHSLLVGYVTAGSRSLKFGVCDIEVKNGSVCVSIEQKNNPNTVTLDLADWLVLIAIEDEEIRDCSSFDAILDNSQK